MSTIDEKVASSSNSKDADQSKKRQQHLLGGIFVTTVAGTSAGLGFVLAAASTKKFQVQSKNAAAIDIGAFGFAFRALGWGTLYAVTGVGALTVGVSLLMGVRNLKEFRQSMEKFFKSHVPDIPRNKNPGRSDFKSFRELFEHLAAGGESSLEKSPKKN